MGPSSQRVLLSYQAVMTVDDGGLTREEVLGSQVADTQAEDGQFVQSGGDLLGERQQAGQALQLPVQPVSMPFGRVGLGPFRRRLLHPEGSQTKRKVTTKSSAVI